MSLFYAQTSGGSPLPTKLNVTSSHWYSKSFTKVPINLSFLARLSCFQAQLQLQESPNPYSFPPPCLPWLMLFSSLAHILSFHICLSKTCIIPGHLKILSVSHCPLSNLTHNTFTIRYHSSFLWSLQRLTSPSLVNIIIVPYIYKIYVPVLTSFPIRLSSWTTESIGPPAVALQSVLLTCMPKPFKGRIHKTYLTFTKANCQWSLCGHHVRPPYISMTFGKTSNFLQLFQLFHA